MYLARAQGLLADRYRLEERIGGGGMAEVHRGLDLRLERPVAIKIPHAYLASDPAFAERLRHEARIVSALEHPGIARLYDYGEAPTGPYLVMEHVPGKNLGAVLEDRVALSSQQVAAIASDILDALEHAHSRGVLHRDLKPENVLITPEGRAKLVDFGIALAGAAATVTRPGHVVGSVHYLAPERLAGEQATAASDLYAVGVLLYRMLTGRLPFEGDLDAVVVALHRSHHPTPPSQLRPTRPGWWDEVVEKALAKDPMDRYPSAAAMNHDMARRNAALHESPTAEVTLPAFARPGPPGVEDSVGRSWSDENPPAEASTPGASASNGGKARPSTRGSFRWVAYGMVLGSTLLAAGLLLGGALAQPSTDFDGGPTAGPTATESAGVPRFIAQPPVVPTSTRTATARATASPTATATARATASPTPTQTARATASPTPTARATASPTRTVTPTLRTATPTPTPRATPTQVGADFDWDRSSKGNGSRKRR